eukprot:8229331-Pyramimonas_sp.AAC.1
MVNPSIGSLVTLSDPTVMWLSGSEVVCFTAKPVNSPSHPAFSHTRLPAAVPPNRPLLDDDAAASLPIMDT